MKNTIFFADLKEGSGKTLLNKLDSLLDHMDLKGKIREKDFVAIKLHFGEKGNTGFVRPHLLRKIVDRVKQFKGKPFLTDTNTLYTGTRSEAVSHLTTASEHGFSLENIGIPVMISDGLRGRNYMEAPVAGKHFRKVKVASDISDCDSMLALNHITGHILTGVGGAIKNVGMGCSSRRGKRGRRENSQPLEARRASSNDLPCIGWTSRRVIIRRIAQSQGQISKISARNRLTPLLRRTSSVPADTMVEPV